MKLLIKTGIILCSLLIFSCNNDNESYLINTTANLELEFNSGLRNQEITLSLISENNDDFTQEAIFYVDGNPLSGNVFSSPETGVYRIYAEYNLAGTITATTTKDIEIIIPEREIFMDLIMDRTNGLSPRLNSFLDEAKTFSNNITAISWLSYNTDPVDPLASIESTYMIARLGGGITASVDRFRTLSPSNIELYITEAIETEAPVSIAINSSVNNQTLSVEVNVISEQEMFENKLCVYLVEDNVVASQANNFNNNQNSEWFQKGDPILDFSFDHLFRKSLTDILGNYMETTPGLIPVSNTFEIEIPIDYDINNLKIIALVTESTDIIPINSQIVNIGSSVPFE